MNKETYLLKCITPLHIGAGQGLGYIDLPIVREVHTNFPYIPGSSLKGAIRNYYLSQLAKKLGKSPAELDKKLSEGKVSKESELYDLAKVFGIAGEGTSEKSDLGAGKVIFTDAFIVLFPVRSIRGVYSLVTCPIAINRLYELLDKEQRMEPIEEGKAKVIDMNNHLNLVNQKLLLEEFVFEVEKEESLREFSKLFSHIIENVEKRLVCVSDTDFRDFVSSYTEVQTHIKINLETGTVDSKALWTEEYVPSESVFAFSLIYLEDMNFGPPEHFHLGGDITTGKGFVKVRRVEHEKN